MPWREVSVMDQRREFVRLAMQERLAIRPLADGAQYGVFFAAHQVAIIDLASGNSVGHVPEHPSAMSPG
jgi:hypothetical protein